MPLAPARSSVTRRARLVAWVWACLLVALPVHAQTQEPAAPGPPDARPLVTLEWSGEARLRTEWLQGVGLVTDSTNTPLRFGLRHDGSTVDPLLSGGSVGTGDLRLRLRPVLRVAEWSEVHAQLDLADGLVLGDLSREDFLARLTGDPSQSVTSGIAVRRLWAKVRLFGLAELLVGRTPDHFGMGMLRNQGGSLGGDYQSDVDRVAVLTDLIGVHWMLARDTMASWPATRSTGEDPLQSWEDAADVIRWVVEASGGRKPADTQGLAWSAAVLWQTQDRGLSLEHDVDPAGPALVDSTDCLVVGTCAGVVPRGASIVTSQAALDWRSGDLHFEAEGAFQYGTFERTEPLPRTDTSKTLVAGGLATRTTWRRGPGELKLDAGLATGEGDGGFGVLDTDNFHQPGSSDAQRSLLTGFRFHREFRVDGLMFRDLIGAVANAWYLRPSWRHDLLPTGTDTGLRVEAAVLTAGAASPDATPGGAEWLGLEPELVLDYRGASCGTGLCLEGQLRGSWLMPGAAWDDGTGGLAAQSAWRTEALLRLAF